MQAISTMTPSQSPSHEGEMKNQKVLIIGDKGMLGQALARELRSGNKLFLWDRGEIDLANVIDYRLSIIDLQPDLIINSAAYTNVDKAEREKDLADKINGYAVGELAKICRELDIGLVHFSTEYVFDGEKKEGYSETDRSNPVSAYGASKYLGERELQKNTDKFYLIRLSRLFGRDTQAGKKSFVNLMLELAKSKREIEVVDEELSCPTYAPDLAKLTRYIIDEKLPYGIYHGANSGACTWFGFAKEIFKIAAINVKLIPVAASRFPRLAKRPQYGVLLNTKLPPQRAWQKALKEFLKQ